MILNGWHVDGYGILSDHHTADVEPGLCVVFGPNEAGKSTLLSFLRSTLFGTSGAAAMPALRGGSPGGRVFLRADDGGRWTVERHGRRVRLLDPQGQPAVESALSQLLGGADARLFRAIFAFDLGELSRFESLTDAGVRDQVFSAGITGAGATASQARQQLEAEVAQLVRPQSTQGRLNALAAELREVRKALHAARQAAAEYPERVARQDAAQEQAAQLAVRLDEMGQRTTLLEILLRLWEPWNRWRALREDLSRLPAPVVAPEAGAELERVRAARQRARDALEQALEQQRTLRRDTEALRLAPELEAIAVRAAAAAATAAAQRQRLEQLGHLRAQEVALEDRLAQRLAALGPGLDVARLPDHRLPVATADSLRTWRARAEAAERVVGQAGQDLRQARDARCEADREVDARRGARDALADEADLAAVEARRAQLERVERLLPAVRALPVWLALALAGCAAVAATAGPRPGPAGVGADLLALAAAALAIAGLGRQWRDAALTLGTAAGALGLPARPSPRQLEAAHRQLRAAAEGANRRQDAVTALAQAEVAAAQWAARGQSAAAHLEEARAQAGELEAQWAEWRREQGLPPGLSPEGCGEFIRALQGVHEVALDLEEARTRRRGGLAAADAWRDEAHALLAAGGRAVPADGCACTVEVEALASQARLAVERRARWEELRRQAAELEPRLEQARRAWERADAEHAALLASAGAADADAFLQRVVEAQGFAQRQRDAEQLERTLRDPLGSGPYGDKLRFLLAEGGPADWQAERARLETQAVECRSQRDAAIEARTLAERQLQELEASADVASLSGREEALRAECAEALAQWRRLRLAQALLGRTLEDFVRDRQPEVLAAASRAFALVTEGRYTHVVQQVQGDAALAVLDRAGARRTPRELSRGTAEQLYLALRLGLAEAFARRSVALPLILDDVLVNFDSARAEAMLRALQGYLDTGGRQVLLFTCHDQTLEMARAVCGGCRVVDLSPREPAALASATDAAAAADATVEGDGVAAGLDAAADFFRREGPAGVRRLQDAFGLEAAAARRMIRTLLASGRIRSEGHGRGTRYGPA